MTDPVKPLSDEEVAYLAKDALGDGPFDDPLVRRRLLATIRARDRRIAELEKAGDAMASEIDEMLNHILDPVKSIGREAWRYTRGGGK